MRDYRALWVVASLVVGALQAWDSGALNASGFVRGLIAVGILLPAISIGVRIPHGARIAALVTGALILAWARMISPVSLNALHIALFVPAIYILFAWRMGDHLRRATS